MNNSDIERALIEKCIELYEGIIDERIKYDTENSHSDTDYGVPPQYLSIEMYDAVRKTEHYYKRTFLKAWTYRDGVLVGETDESDAEEDFRRSGMYYKRATGDFYWDLEKKKAFVNMTYGPRYARGYSFDICIEDKIYLENEEIMWVS